MSLPLLLVAVALVLALGTYTALEFARLDEDGALTPARDDR